MREACERWPARPAVTYRGSTRSYGELWTQVLNLAWAYRSLGVSEGDRIVCQLPTCPELLIAANAAWACGAIHVGAHRDLTPVELGGLVAQSGATAVVVQPPAGVSDPDATLRAVREASRSTVTVLHHPEPPAGQRTLSDLLAQPSGRDAPPATSGPEQTADTALLLRTSGTTGEPKLVQENLPALWAKVAFFADAVGPQPDDVHLMYLPISHVFGLKLALMALASGGRLILQDPFSPDEALRLVQAEGVTVTAGSPTHLALLLDRLEAGDHRVDSLRWIATAAATLPPALVPRVYEQLGAELLSVYGCSEGFLTCTTARDEIERGSVGSTVFRAAGAFPAPPDGRVTILDLEHPIPLPAGEVGEIAFGTTQPVRYWSQPPVGTDGWYRTGDLGWLDADGLLFVSGRLKEVVNRGGLKVAAGEIEVALAEHPDVADCAVVPAPDPVLGEAICACVVPAGARPPNLSEVREHLRGRLARHKLPDELCVVESIPRSSVGKVDRSTVIAFAADRDRPRERLRPPAAGAAEHGSLTRDVPSVPD